MSDDQHPTMIERPTPNAEDFAKALCADCGITGCRSCVRGRFLCAQHEPQEIRDGRMMALACGLYDLLSGGGFLDGGLSVAMLLMHMIGNHAEQSLDELQHGLSAQEAVFKAAIVMPVGAKRGSKVLSDGEVVGAAAGILSKMSDTGLLDSEGLSVTALLIHMIGRQTQQSLDELQHELVQAQLFFNAHFPNLVNMTPEQRKLSEAIGRGFLPPAKPT